MTAAAKLLRLVRGGYSPRQVLLRINRSPLRYAVKTVASLAHWNTKRARHRAAAVLPKSPEAIARAQALRRVGFTWLEGELDSELLEELQVEAQAVMTEAEDGSELTLSHKDFWRSLLDRHFAEGRIDECSVFVRHALQPAVVETLADYFSEIPRLAYVHLALSQYSAESSKVSQLWHLDYDDVRVVKLFTYLTDVLEEADGPFTFLPAEPSRRINAFGAAHLPDETVFARVDRKQVRHVTAPVGGSFMVNTSRCYHMGSRIAPGHSRMLYSATFVTAPSIYPHFRTAILCSNEVAPLTRMLLDV